MKRNHGPLCNIRFMSHAPGSVQEVGVAARRVLMYQNYSLQADLIMKSTWTKDLQVKSQVNDFL